MLRYAHLVSDKTIYEGIKCFEDKRMKIGLKSAAAVSIYYFCPKYTSEI
jgi:hypothetical protein